MTSHSLVVDVVSAYGFSNSLDLPNPCVELHFAGQISTTSVKKNDRCPKWNERILFNVWNRNSVSSLEAYVCNVIGGYKSVLGRVTLSGSSFADSPDVDGKNYQLKGLIFQRSKGRLFLKVFLRNEAPVVTSDHSPMRQAVQEPPIQPVDALPKEIKRKFGPGLIVEHMPYIFVHVVKAKCLPNVKARGRLDPRVEVKVGDYRGKTDCVHNDQNPEWNTTFAFSKLQMDCDKLTRIYVVVKDVDMVEDEFVGMVFFDLSNIPDKSAVQQWYKLVDKSAKEKEGELMLAVWRGSQADEAFPDAQRSDSFHVEKSMLPHIGPKVYDLPRLWYLRVEIVELTCIAVESGARLVEVYVTAAVGGQILKTKRVKRPLAHYVWNENLMFVAAEPFEDDLQICVRAHLGPDRDKVVAHIAIPLETFKRRVDNQPIEAQCFKLQMQPQVQYVDGGGESTISLCHIFLRNYLEGGYNARYDSMDYNDDLRPAANETLNPAVVGLLEIGILRANDLPPRERRNGKRMLHPYCVAKYGRKWVRTHTIYNSCNPVFNEQHAWDVYDTATVLTIGVFHNAQLERYSSGEDMAVNIGKVRIRLCNLQPGRTYVHSYPLLIQQPSGVKKMGELYLAVRFSSKSLVKMLRMYSSPMLPKIHYEHRLSMAVEKHLQFYAVKLVASHMSRMEPTLLKEVVEYMCDVGGNLWSIRKSKANLFRITPVLSFFVTSFRWFYGVCLWKNPATTLLAHALYVMLVLYPELVLPVVLLYIFVMNVWTYWQHPTYPPHFSTRLCYAERAHSDELDEEFNTFTTSWDFDFLRVGYDRIRTIAGTTQTVLGDLASCLERIQAFASWRDITTSAILGLFTLAAAVILYYAPWKILIALAGLYTMRHPMLRRETSMPSCFQNFYWRLPDNTDSLL